MSTQDKNLHRIYGEKIEIEDNHVQDFFQVRAQKANKSGSVVSMLYQDDNPELAHQRDEFEKDKFLKLLKINKEDSVLDLGCGLGRWTQNLAPQIGYYHGIDPVPDLITLAKNTFKNYAHVSFQILPAQDATPKTIQGATKFSLVLNTGVLHYLNDSDCEKIINNIPLFCHDKARVLIRVPVSIAERLTLNKFWSEELQQYYNAIYREADHYRTYLERALIPAGFEYVYDEALYPEDMNNRAETQQHFFLLERV